MEDGAPDKALIVGGLVSGVRSTMFEPLLGPLTRGYAAGDSDLTENRVSGGSALSRLQK